MSMATDIVIDEVSPAEAYDVLNTTQDTALIDVRTQAEWDRIGVPDISQTGRPMWFIEWVSGPAQPPNPRFGQELLERAGDVLPSRMFFICRSGARSAAAANAVAVMADRLGQKVQCTNVAEGFECSPAFGEDSGWRARGLPWRGM